MGTKLYNRMKGLSGLINPGMILCAGLSLATPAFAQTSGTGGVVSPFTMGGSARSLGMGGAMAAITGQGESFFQNPAALATLNEHEILTFHEPLLLDSNYDSAGYTNPVGLHNSFGAAFARLGTGNI